MPLGAACLATKQRKLGRITYLLCSLYTLAIITKPPSKKMLGGFDPFTSGFLKSSYLRQCPDTHTQPRDFFSQRPGTHAFPRGFFSQCPETQAYLWPLHRQ
jgi:hypothetical protein